MININTILVPFVDSPSAIGALKTAIAISKINHSQLMVIHVVNDKTPENLLETVKNICSPENAVFTFMERSGNISREIIKAEKECSANLIIMGAYGLTGWQKFWVGSNAFKVISTSHCPVLTLQNDVGTFKGFNKIMLPLDDSEETRQKGCQEVIPGFLRRGRVSGLSPDLHRSYFRRYCVYVYCAVA